MSAAEVSSTRLYLGNLPRTATKQDVENHFATHGTGKITEVKLMNGFGFIEYEDAMDARDVVPAFHGSDFMGERLVVQFARGSRRNENYPHPSERSAPRPRRTPYRMQITGLPAETSWQDLKDFARQSGLDVVYSEVGRERDGRGFVEYETEADLRNAVEKLDNREFKGQAVRCTADIGPPPPQSEHPRSRYRSRSPGPPRRGGYGGGPDDYYGRPPRRDYSPRREDYRRRSPPPRDDYYSRGRYDRSPPRQRRGGPPDDYPPPRGGRYPPVDDVYDARGPPPPRGGAYPDEPYANGHGRPYGGGSGGGPPSPRRRSPGGPPRAAYGDPGYERPRYW